MSAISSTTYCIENIENKKEELTNHLLRLPPNDRRNRFMYTLDDDGVREYIDKVGSPCDKVFGAYTVCRQEEKSVSVLAGVSQLVFEGKAAEIAMSVDAFYRRTGCGSALMNHAISYAKALGYSELKIVCFSENTSMVGLAEKTGFTLKLKDYGEYEGYLNI